MANIIEVSEIQAGDTIAVTTTSMDGDRTVTVTYTGVAHHLDGAAWRTEQDWNLYVNERGAVIELLDRPEPEPLVPSGVGAVVSYTVDFDLHFPARTAIRNDKGVWRCYNAKGDEQDLHYSDADFTKFLNVGKFTPVVLFAGIGA